METGLPQEVKDIIFLWRGACEVRLNPCKMRLKRTSENSEKLKFSFWVEGTLGDDIWWGRFRRTRWWWGSGGRWQMAVADGGRGRMGDGREPDRAGPVEARRTKWHGKERMTVCRRARWQFVCVAWGRSSRWWQPGARSGGKGS